MKPIYIAEDVYLRELEIADAPDMFNLINSQRNYLGRWLPFVENTRDENDSRSFIQSVINAPADRREHIFAIISEGAFAGIIGFKGTDRDNKKTEIGYWLGEDFQGRGIMTLAVEALCHMAFNSMGMNQIQILCAVGNTRSSNIPRRLGFVFEGVEREGELLTSGKFTDVEVFSILKREFEHTDM